MKVIQDMFVFTSVMKPIQQLHQLDGHNLVAISMEKQLVINLDIQLH